MTTFASSVRRNVRSPPCVWAISMGVSSSWTALETSQSTFAWAVATGIKAKSIRKGIMTPLFDNRIIGFHRDYVGRNIQIYFLLGTRASYSVYFHVNYLQLVSSGNFYRAGFAGRTGIYVSFFRVKLRTAVTTKTTEGNIFNDQFRFIGNSI